MKKMIWIIASLIFFTANVNAGTAKGSNPNLESYITSGDWSALRKAIDIEPNIEEASSAWTKGENLTSFDYYPKLNMFIGTSRKGAYSKTYAEVFDLRDDGTVGIKKIEVGYNGVSPIIYKDRIVSFDHCSGKAYFHSLSTGKLLKKIKATERRCVRRSHFVNGKFLYTITFRDRSSLESSRYWSSITHIDMDKMVYLGKPNGVSVHHNEVSKSIRSKWMTRLKSYQSHNTFGSKNGIYDYKPAEQVTELENNKLALSVNPYHLSVKSGSISVDFFLSKADKKSKMRMQRVGDDYFALNQSNRMYVFSYAKLQAYIQQYDKDEQYKDALIKEIKEFVANINFAKRDTAMLRAFAQAFPEYLSPSEIEKRLGTYYTTQAKDKYKLNILSSIAQGKFGERYVPTVTNTYYTSEDQSYTVDGHYVHKTKQKSNEARSGGYDVDIVGYKYVFALDNKSTEHYIVDIEATWTATEFFYKKERYCMQRGFIFCSQYGDRNVKKSRKQKKKQVQSFLVGSNGRVKHSFYLGEESPNDIEFFPSKIKKVPAVDFKLFDLAMSKVAFKDEKKTLSAIKTLKNKTLFSPFYGALISREKEVVKYFQDKFSKEHINDVTVSVNFKSDYDPDFNNDITLTITANDVALDVLLDTPFGDKRIKVSSLEHGYYFKALDYCFFCSYENKLVINDVKGIKKSKLRKAVKVKYVYDIE